MRAARYLLTAVGALLVGGALAESYAASAAQLLEVVR